MDTQFSKISKTGHIFKVYRGKFTSLSVVFKAGTLYEPENRKGVSHLMEHLICKAVQKFDERFINDCIDYNAVTSIDYVEFYFRGLREKLTPEFKKQIVKELLGGFNITQEQFDTEKEIVTKEITDSFEDPFEGNQINCYYKFYDIVDPGGFPEHVAAFTLDEAKQMYADKFTKPLRIVEVADKPTDFSDVEYSKDIPMPIELRFKNTKKSRAKEILPANSGEKAHMFVFTTKTAKRTEYRYLRVGLEILMEGFNSPFMQEIREKRGLAYYIHSELQSVVDRTFVWFYAATDKDKAEELKQVFKDICRNVRTYLTKERFDMALNRLNTARIIQKISLWKFTDRYTEYEHPHLPPKLHTIDYEKMVGIVEKYLYNIEVFEY